MKNEKNLLSGSTTLLVLSLLKDEDMYGYQMVEELALRSDHTFELKEGTLYPLLHTMEHEGYVKAYTQLTPNGRERKYYHLTKDGEAYLALKTEQWRLFSSKVDAVIGAPRCTV